MIALLASLAFASDTPEHVRAWRAAVDWDRAGDESSRWLADYLRVDTVAPPGNEMDGVRYLQSLLHPEGIETEVIDHGDNRGSLVARLPGDGSKPPLCLLSHIDVVPSERDKWTFEPLSGTIEDGTIFGRGALDMKGMGILELAAMLHLKRLEVPLEREVILLAVADEEVDGIGMLETIEHHWDRIGCSHMINEGGLGIHDALFEGQTLHAISVAEKGTLWMRMVAEGRAGHGSTIEEDEAPKRLVEAMALLEKKYKPKVRIDPSLYTLLANVGRHKGGITGAVLRSKFLVNTIVKGQLKAEPTTLAAITDTLHLTGMGGASSVNVVPSSVWAQYDSRILPGTDPEALLKEFQHITRKVEGIRWEVLQKQEANGSPWDDPFYEAIAHYAVEDRPDAVAGPVLSPGFTDSIFARPLGVKAYGYVPFEITQDEGLTMHGHDERVSVENMREGTRRMFSIVLHFAGKAPDDVAPIDAAAADLEKLRATQGFGDALVARVAALEDLEGPGRAVVLADTRLWLTRTLSADGTPQSLETDALEALVQLLAELDGGAKAAAIEAMGCDAAFLGAMGLPLCDAPTE